MKELKEEDFIKAAKIIGCEVAVIKAVAEVESAGKGFNSNNTPKILFEGHWFHKLTNGIYTNKLNSNISYPKWIRKYYNQNQHKRLQKAVKLDRNAALMSASWGKFQIMGFNYKKCGFDTVQQFINTMYRSEADHLFAFLNYIKSRKLEKYLISKDWARFAYYYNGKGYRKNKYDTKLNKSYLKFK